MSQATQTETGEHEHTAFWQTYYADEVADLATKYPSEKRSIRVDWGDVLRYDADLADDYLVAPGAVGDELSQALADYPIPNVELTDVDVRVVGLNREEVYSPLEVTRDTGDRDESYVGVRGELAKVTEPKKEIQEASFECQRCSGTARVHWLRATGAVPRVARRVDVSSPRQGPRGDARRRTRRTPERSDRRERPG